MNNPYNAAVYLTADLIALYCGLPTAADLEPYWHLLPPAIRGQWHADKELGKAVKSIALAAAAKD